MSHLWLKTALQSPLGDICNQNFSVMSHLWLKTAPQSPLGDICNQNPAVMSRFLRKVGHREKVFLVYVPSSIFSWKKRAKWDMGR